MGPAFFFSLWEMSWGQKRDLFKVRLSARVSEIVAYPSFNFRLSCVQKAANVFGFLQATVQELGKLNIHSLQDSLSAIERLHIDDKKDSVSINPDSDPDATIVRQAILANIDELKSGLLNFLEKAESKYRIASQDSIEDVPSTDLAALIARLENRILPNVVPDGSLLGRPASFRAILNAASLYRFNALVSTKERVKSHHDPIGDGSSIQDNVFTLGSKIERLTAKALEVSFVQREFLEWSKQGNERS